MPQLRQNIITGEWVVIAPERAKRPHDFIVTANPVGQPAEGCPFCPDGPAYQNRFQEFDTQNTAVIANKFPAFVSEGHHEVRSYFPERHHFYQAKPAIGGHDVIIVKEHELRVHSFPKETMVDLLTSIQKRYQIYRDDPAVEYVMAIYNHGDDAGASISHPHAQIFASSVIPNHLLKEKHGSERYYELNGACVYCDMISHEREEGCRLLVENDDFFCFTFYAARFPFEIWILPKTHQSMYEEATAAQLASLADILHQALEMLNMTLKDPALNFFIHSLPTTSEGAEYYHWHLEIAPRVAKYGGFELGGGTIIDVVSPEKAAEFLLGKDVDQAPTSQPAQTPVEPAISQQSHS